MSDLPPANAICDRIHSVYRTVSGPAARRMNANTFLWHGGAPGFRVGETIYPHETKHMDDCELCRQGLDDNHLPDRVFCTTHRLYAKHYASKWGNGWLYQVRCGSGELVQSNFDPFESFHASELIVVRVAERGITLTMSERRNLWRQWKESDRQKGIKDDLLNDLRFERMIGIAR